ncbi:hypothetical protein QMK19_35260 [Streptomyces sp. H10-C2]|uniref:hypothetical protein n=1 Tax=unclassified Streptomyces TaxID=2593676 RepID=UPI0024BA6A08|nr:MULTISPECIES: hypothetical protein [unclassified Streptomyces]MDJ0345894.1 hypothetical protein [Streptomyces sp. PH10-H1]MDJ0374743.1 hypothetical protein [Streptomyces sp. H10-C2]
MIRVPLRRPQAPTPFTTSDPSALALHLMALQDATLRPQTFPTPQASTPRQRQEQLLAGVQQLLDATRTVLAVVDSAVASPVAETTMTLLYNASCDLQGALPALYEAVLDTIPDDSDDSDSQ